MLNPKPINTAPIEQPVLIYCPWLDATKNTTTINRRLKNKTGWFKAMLIRIKGAKNPVWRIWFSDTGKTYGHLGAPPLYWMEIDNV